MDFWINLGISAVLQLLQDKSGRLKFYPALAKVYAKIALTAKMDHTLMEAIQVQLEKEGLQ